MFKFYRIYRVLSKIFILASVLFFAVKIVSAQNPDLALTDAERDSVLKNYDQIFQLQTGKIACFITDNGNFWSFSVSD